MKKYVNNYWPGNYIIIESPYQGEIERNILYARRCMRDSIHNGEWPFASHLLYTQEGILNDSIPIEREIGLVCCEMWSRKADVIVFYIDYGMSDGMKRAEEAAITNGRTIVFRKIGRK